MAPVYAPSWYLRPLPVLRECLYCGRFTNCPMDHGPGRCWTPPDLPAAAA